MAGAANGRRLRCLCLHGSRQDSEIFQQRLEKLVKKMADVADFHFLDAPHLLPLVEGQEVPMRAWWRPEEVAGSCQAPNQRIVEDWKASMEAIREAWVTEGPFDGVLGFSNGAAAGLVLSASATFPPFQSLRFAVLASGYVPEPFQELVGGSATPSVASLHLIGQADDLVPPAASMAAAKTLTHAQVYRHPGGHIVPQKAADIQVVRDFFLEQLDAIRADEACSAMLGSEPAGFAGLVGENGSFSLAAEVAEELEALEAIFMEEYELVSESPCRFTIHLRDPGGGEDPPEAGEAPVSTCFRLVFTLSPGYPSVAPQINAVGPLSSRHPLRSALDKMLSAATDERLETPMIYELVELAREWINTNVPKDVGAERPAKQGHCSSASVHEAQADTDDDEAPVAAASAWYLEEDIDASAVDAASQLAATQCRGDSIAHIDRSSGRWDYTIGLVGKPSAGKSTFFNAATDPDSEQVAARVAAFPFTTIDPNLGYGAFTTPCPCQRVGIRAEVCGAAGGHVELCASAAIFKKLNIPGLPAGMTWRHVRIALKDVAGLVPGAYQGRGRGNSFLNDLCDADVLLHIVDASGTTDSEGAATLASEGSNPLDEIRWLRRELHCWIFSNIRAKWPTVIRRPNRLPTMFTGYHATPAIISDVLAKCKVDASSPASLDTVRSWDANQVHMLVAHFLRRRFPTLLVLNKADLPSAAERIQMVQNHMPDDPCVPASAESEWWLCRARRNKQIRYVTGSEVCEALIPDASEKAETIQATVLDKYGSTGVQVAVSAAVALRPPALAFPVRDLESCRAMTQRGAGAHAEGHSDGQLQQESAQPQAHQGDGSPVLRDCVILKPATTVGALYEVLRKPPHSVIDGEYVRAECRTAGGGGGGALVRKDDLLNDTNNVIRIMCNKKKGFVKRS